MKVNTAAMMRSKIALSGGFSQSAMVVPTRRREAAAAANSFFFLQRRRRVVGSPVNEAYSLFTQEVRSSGRVSQHVLAQGLPASCDPTPGQE